jgi:hypothetical protein
MLLSDIKIRNSKPPEKAYKVCDTRETARQGGARQYIEDRGR